MRKLVLMWAVMALLVAAVVPAVAQLEVEGGDDRCPADADGRGGRIDFNVFQYNNSADGKANAFPDCSEDLEVDVETEQEMPIDVQSGDIDMSADSALAGDNSLQNIAVDQDPNTGNWLAPVQDTL